MAAPPHNPSFLHTKAPCQAPIRLPTSDLLPYTSNPSFSSSDLPSATSPRPRQPRSTLRRPIQALPPPQSSWIYLSIHRFTSPLTKLELLAAISWPRIRHQALPPTATDLQPSSFGPIALYLGCPPSFSLGRVSFNPPRFRSTSSPKSAHFPQPQDPQISPFSCHCKSLEPSPPASRPLQPPSANRRHSSFSSTAPTSIQVSLLPNPSSKPGRPTRFTLSIPLTGLNPMSVFTTHLKPFQSPSRVNFDPLRLFQTNKKKGETCNRTEVRILPEIKAEGREETERAPK